LIVVVAMMSRGEIPARWARREWQARMLRVTRYGMATATRGAAHAEVFITRAYTRAEVARQNIRWCRGKHSSRRAQISRRDAAPATSVARTVVVTARHGNAISQRCYASSSALLRVSWKARASHEGVSGICYSDTARGQQMSEIRGIVVALRHNMLHERLPRATIRHARCHVMLRRVSARCLALPTHARSQRVTAIR